MNYFIIFDFDLNYDIDLRVLEERYLQLQLKYHPDRLISKSTADKDEFLEKSSLLNQAYKILLDPLARAKYLLTLNQIDLDKEMTNLPQDVLEETFLDRENLEDNILNAPELQTLLVNANKLCQNYQHNISTAFKKNDLQQAVYYTVYLQYKTKFISEIQQKLRMIQN